MKAETALTPAQKWEAATLADNFIFCKVMTANPELCRELLEILLGIEIERIEEPHAEHAVKCDYGSKGIRFDVYVKDGSGRCFDIEIQTSSRKNLARRARYYQSLMDVDSLASGEDYSELKDSYVIFLCLDDPFERSLPVYSFSNICAEEKTLELGDGAYKIFYNAAKHDIMPEGRMKTFFRFLAGKSDGSSFAGRLAAMVERAKTNAQWRHQFMTWEQELKIQAQERAEVMAVGMAQKLAVGMAEEIAEGRVEETARKLLGEAIAPQTVARCTGLPLEQVEQLLRQSAAEA